MKSAFLTEMEFEGRIPLNHPNMRTEFAWMCTLEADHYNIHSYEKVKGYDAVFIIFPKSTVKLNTVGVEMIMPGGVDRDMSIYSKPVVEVLKSNNKKICNVQEGPCWFFNEYDLDIQFHFFNQLSACDILLAHNTSDVKFYKGLFPNKKVDVIPTLMIAPYIENLPSKENKAIIGGNFCRWYGGFQSYIVTSNFRCPIYVPSSHCKRNGEEQVPNLQHLPWVIWNQWIIQLSTFKYAVNLMPTVAAGTFSMNCAYWGIPCIGNKNVDTQKTLFEDLSVDVDDVETASDMALELYENDVFYDNMSKESRKKLFNSYHFDQNKWITHIHKIINE
jgi:hypothetical protein